MNMDPNVIICIDVNWIDLAQRFLLLGCDRSKN
jgi:hypothetical protein